MQNEIAFLSSFNYDFPDPQSANSDGIVAIGGSLNPTRLLRAYSMGIFPWFGKNDPIIWWSVDPRLVLKLEDFKLRKSLKKSMKKFTYKFDTNFRAIITECANKQRDGQNGTWITPDVIEAYCELHTLGHAHSIETYLDGELVGGLYGIVVGGMFCGESMFSHVSDASKAAFATLIEHLKKWGYDIIDCQVPTNHLKSLGAIEISRSEFLDILDKTKLKTPTHSWKLTD